MRIQGKLRLGYFPLPLTEARRIRACVRYPDSPFSAIDPCVGDGAAFLTITGESCARRYGIELDAYRAEQSAAVVDEMVHGDCLDVHCPVLGSRSALEWVIDQYQVKGESDPNREDDPSYIVRLAGQVVRVSMDTVRIVKGLPEYR